jgi:hypothetical protein
MKRATKHVTATVVGAILGVVFVGWGPVCLLVWFILGDAPSDDSPILKIYLALYFTSPILGALYANHRVNKAYKKKRTDSLEAFSQQTSK